MNTAIIFSGQGSQYVGMMKDIAEKYPQGLEIIEKANKILGYRLSDICFDGPIETLKETRYTQPALFVHSAVITKLLGGRLEYSAVAGHSIGEYAALFAAGVLDFEDALKLVSLRGELMFNTGEHEPGTMFAVIGLADEKVEQVSEELTAKGNGNAVVAANYNSPGQIVVSGSADYLRQNIGAYKEAGARIVKELVVSGAFHSPLMAPAKGELEKAIQSTNFRDAEVPIYTNVYAAPLMESEKLKEALIAQLTSPVKWTQSLIAMQVNGIERFIEAGPGNVLQGLVKRTLKNVTIEGIDTASDIEKYL